MLSGEIPASLPDLSIAYKLHLECPRLVIFIIFLGKFLVKYILIIHDLSVRGVPSVGIQGAYAPIKFWISPEGGKKIRISVCYEINPGTAIVYF